MGYVNSNLAWEVGRLAKWREKIWSRRYQAIPVSQLHHGLLGSAATVRDGACHFAGNQNFEGVQS